MQGTSAIEAAKGFSETKQKILMAASEVFAENGFRYGTIREIAEKAGANVAGVNYYFSSKEELYFFVVRYWLEMTFHDFPYAELADQGLPARERFLFFIRATVSRVFDPTRPAAYAMLFIREATIEQTEVFDELIRETVAPNTALLRSIINELTEGRLDDAGLDFYAANTIGQCLFFHINRKIIHSTFNIDLDREGAAEELAARISAYALGAVTSIL
ncbi:MAG: CerR family C-terminal domain-containing protein [Gracilibacteraceae bacterium]|nr:CerR family C-terminal domain-containing protein [Gracilibacteraceae bacterium]